MMEETSMDAILVGRFFSALARLKSDRVIRGTQTFTNIYGINRRNLWTLQKKSVGGLFHPSWLSYLVNDFKVSAHWLLTGEGSFYSPGWDADNVKAMVKSRKQ